MFSVSIRECVFVCDFYDSVYSIGRKYKKIVLLLILITVCNLVIDFTLMIERYHRSFCL